MKRIMPHLSLIGFAFLTTIVLVISSEQLYWYPMTWDVFGVALFYLSTVVITLWVIDRFKVRSLPAVIVVAALYGIITEGVITPLIYEGGPLDPVFVSWTSLAWHALFSFILLWYLFRKWAIDGKFIRLGVTALLFGVFIGFWSLTYTLPENTVFPSKYSEALTEEGREAFEPLTELDDGSVFRATEILDLSPEDEAIIEEGLANSTWPVNTFATYVTLMSVYLIAAHYLLGRFFWHRAFTPSKVLTILALLFLLGWYTFTVIFIPWAPLKLGVILLPIFLALWVNKKRETKSVLEEFDVRIKLSSLLPILALPIGATVAFWLGNSVPFSEETIRIVFFGGSIATLTIIGWLVFLYGLIQTFRGKE